MTLTTRAMHMMGTNLLHSICFSALPFEMLWDMTTEVVIEANVTLAT